MISYENNSAVAVSHGYLVSLASEFDFRLCFKLFSFGLPCLVLTILLCIQLSLKKLEQLVKFAIEALVFLVS